MYTQSRVFRSHKVRAVSKGQAPHGYDGSVVMLDTEQILYLFIVNGALARRAKLD